MFPGDAEPNKYLSLGQKRIIPSFYTFFHFQSSSITFSGDIDASSGPLNQFFFSTDKSRPGRAVTGCEIIFWKYKIL